MYKLWTLRKVLFMVLNCTIEMSKLISEKKANLMSTSAYQSNIIISLPYDMNIITFIRRYVRILICGHNVVICHSMAITNYRIICFFLVLFCFFACLFVCLFLSFFLPFFLVASEFVSKLNDIHCSNRNNSAISVLSEKYIFISKWPRCSDWHSTKRHHNTMVIVKQG